MDLSGHQMVRVGFDLIIIGGVSTSAEYSGSVIKLTCSNQFCEWQTLSQIGDFDVRFEFVAVTVPNNFMN